MKRKFALIDRIGLGVGRVHVFLPFENGPGPFEIDRIDHPPGTGDAVFFVEVFAGSEFEDIEIPFGFVFECVALRVFSLIDQVVEEGDFIKNRFMIVLQVNQVVVKRLKRFEGDIVHVKILIPI